MGVLPLELELELTRRFSTGTRIIAAILANATCNITIGGG
jgi:hypothetical protein